MITAQTERTSSVNRIRLAGTESATLALWITPENQAFSYSGTGVRYGIICANNPINFVDPWGLDPLTQSQAVTVQWAVNQTAARGFPRVAADLQTRLNAGLIETDPKMSSAILGQVNPMNSSVIYLNARYMSQDPIFGNTLIEEYVHTRQLSTPGSKAVSGLATLMSWIQTFAQNAGAVVGGQPWDKDRFYSNDWVERMAKQLADQVFPEGSDSPCK